MLRKTPKTIAVALISAVGLSGCVPQSGIAASGATPRVNQSGERIDVITPVSALPEGASDPRSRSGVAFAFQAQGSEQGIPIVLVPGLGLSSSMFTETPDGRSSWAQAFAAAGHTTYVYNDPSILYDAESEPESGASRWSASRAWTTWGMGPEYGSAYPDAQYPVENFDRLVESFPYHVSYGDGGRGASGGDTSVALKSANLEALMDDRCPCVLAVHSASGPTGFDLAERRPDLVAGLILLEPVGAPTDAAKVESVYRTIPTLGVYGDYIAQRRQSGRKEAVETMLGIINDSGGSSEMIDLPAMGIAGNSHLMSQDRNSNEIAQLILGWIDKTVP
ncbi:hypothetical protein K3172_00450 [Qipengyuania sp. 6B39]|uniref:hypothetical protein n=1 Tax=Qipengyuania proteolytica TaxID=2867239 RepID=UPI001C8AACBD|nr:hypothetical protein [Qipengyuania proteolytica]MBX7494319.1 hypothetical protein [Qipengyuania proteolytica]